MKFKFNEESGDITFDNTPFIVGLHKEYCVIMVSALNSAYDLGYVNGEADQASKTVKLFEEAE